MRHKGLPCAWCGKPYFDGGHVPTRFLILKEDRALLKGEWPVLPACEKCNHNLKIDEEWFVIHFCSALYDFSDKAKKMFDGPITSHLKSHPLIAKRYMKYLKLVNLNIGGQSQGLKTRINMDIKDWRRIIKVADMYARGLYYLYSKQTAKNLKSKIVYITPERFKIFEKHIHSLIRVFIFPGTFEYAINFVPETGEAVVYLVIYGKPSFFITLVSRDRYDAMEEKIKKGEITPKKTPGIEILG